MTKQKGRFVLCLKAGSYKASLEPRKVYRVLEDSVADSKSLLRVVDESGEDYLFPAELFVAIEIPENAEPAFTGEASTAK